MSVEPLASLDRSTLRERALDALRAAIMSGSYRPGDHLGEVELATHLGVSRGTVREALRHLQQEGLVTAGNRGMLRVSTVSPKEVRELFRVRAALEGLAVAEIIASPRRDAAVETLRTARHLRVRRIPAADVGDGNLHAGMEISGGSLGHGLAVAVGMALGLRHQGNPAPGSINFLSDGELYEGSTWEAAMGAAHHGWATSPRWSTSTRCRPTAPPPASCAPNQSPTSGRAFGWHVHRVDGNDVAALVDAFDNADADTAASPRRDPLRHPDRPRRAAAGEPGEGALHAHRRARVADLPRPAHRRTRRSDARHDHRPPS